MFRLYELGKVDRFRPCCFRPYCWQFIVGSDCQFFVCGNLCRFSSYNIIHGGWFFDIRSSFGSMFVYTPPPLRLRLRTLVLHFGRSLTDAELRPNVLTPNIGLAASIILYYINSSYLICTAVVSVFFFRFCVHRCVGRLIIRICISVTDHRFWNMCLGHWL